MTSSPGSPRNETPIAMAASEYSFEFTPGYPQLIEHTFVVWREFINEMLNSDYSFPSTTVSDLRKYCRFDLADIVLVLLLTVAWTALRWLTTEAVFKPLVSYFQLLPSDSKKAPESFWKLLFYTGTVSYNAYLIFFTEEYNFFHRPGFVWEGWAPGMVVGPEVYFYYMIQGSFYVHSIFATIFMDLWRKDSVAMLGHHFITCSLIFLSYGLRYCNIGLLVFLLHDVTDVELEFTKLNVYFKRRGGKFYSSHEYISIFGFISFTATWLITRLYWFPTRALYTSGVLAIGKLHLPFSSLLTFMLWLIFSLNVYWFLYIVMFLIKVVTGQLSELVDTREYDSLAKKKAASLQNGKNSHNGHCTPIASNIKQKQSVERQGASRVRHNVEAKKLIQTIQCFIKLKRKLKRIREAKERTLDEGTSNTDCAGSNKGLHNGNTSCAVQRSEHHHEHHPPLSYVSKRKSQGPSASMANCGRDQRAF